MNSETFISLSNVSTNNFVEMFTEKKINNLRLDVFNFLISRKSEDEFFDIEKYVKNDFILLDILYENLTQAGWKYALSFGDTGLFIFKTEKPRTCW